MENSIQKNGSNFIKPDGYMKKLFKIALPMTLQNLIGSSINMADVFMIGSLGTTSIAAVGLANQITFLYILLLFGINNTASVFISQYYGNKETNNIKKTAALAGSVSLVISVLVTILSLVIPGKLISLYSTDPEVLKIGVSYVKIVAPSYIFTALTVVLSVTLRSTSKTKVPLYGSIAALFTNIGLNYVLIFGKLGFPAMGVNGAAIATVIARTLELAVMFFVSKYNKYDIFPSRKHLHEIDKKFIEMFVKTGLPILGSHVIWSFGTTSLTAIYSRMGTDSLSAMQIAGAIAGIAYTITMGVGSAIGIIVGQELGKKNFDNAVYLAKKLTRMIFFIGGLVGLTLYFFINPIMGFYNITEVARVQSIKVLQYLCFLIPFSGVNFTNMTGTLRAGGDTKFLFMTDTISMWGVGIPIALLTKNLGFTVSSVYLFSTGGENLIKFIISNYRVSKKKWVKSFTH